MFRLYMEDSVSLCRKQQANFEIPYASLILGFYKIQNTPGTEEVAGCLPCKYEDLSLVMQNLIKEPVMVPQHFEGGERWVPWVVGQIA